MYYFIHWRYTPEGYEPALPHEVPFSMLAEPDQASRGAKFALFECDLLEGFEESDSISEVSSELSELLDSAKDYPPALALARDELKLEPHCSEIEFSNKLVERLNHHLQKQVKSPYFMAKAMSTETGYRHAGGYYWIVGCEGERVLWVSRDYYIYRDALWDFELDMSEVEIRFGSRDKI